MIRLIEPYISFEDVEADFRDVFETGWFTKGKHVSALRQALCDYTGAKHAFLATSATTALTVTLKALGIQQGDDVLVADFSFPATANVVEDLGAIPIFVDVDRATYNMSLEDLDRKLTKKTKAVIFVDALGNPTGLHEVYDFCRARCLPLVEDAACALGSAEHDQRCGSVADLTCFSFHPRKLLTTGEGGAITLNSDEHREFLEVKLNHGAVVDASGSLDFVDFGYNYRLPELQAIMAIKQLQKLDEITERRRAFRDSLAPGLSELGFRLQQYSSSVVANVQSVVATVPEGVSRDQLVGNLRSLGVESTIGTYCLSGTSYYFKKYQQRNPVSWHLEKQTITLPCHDSCDAEGVLSAVASALKRNCV